MNEKTLRVLEFSKVLEKLASHTSFAAGRELVLALLPSTDLAEVQTRLDLTSEARRLIEARPDVTLGGSRDMRSAARIAALGRSLDVHTLLELVATLVSSRTLRRLILKQGQSGDFYYLCQIAQRLVDLPLLEGQIEQTISQDGTVLDSASPALKRIRDEIRVAHGRLLEKLNSILSSAQYQPAIQEAIITMREGRYVIPVKNDFKGQLRGIVHDQSASGATVFLEPLAVVDLNNRWKQSQMDEREEIERILRELSAQVARHTNEIVGAVEALAEIDLALAKAKYAAVLRATEPKLSTPDAAGDAENRLLNFIQARHPLLSGKVVPVDIYLGADFRVVVITGPNTGGKTVSIKTAGLLTLMAMAGLHLPVEEGSQALVFQKIFADIGDEQSIEQSLSTFSSHMTNIIGILDAIDKQTLVILDELGAGTDPTEGSALARAIIQLILDRGADAMLTTHYSELKSFAYVTPGVQNASVEFDVQSLSPTYRLSIGLPGRSNALAIASRLGMSEDIIEAARGLLSHEETQVDALLTQIYQEREETADIRIQTIKLRAEAERERDELKRQLRKVEEVRRKAAAEGRQEARQELEAELGEVRQESANLRRQLIEIEQAARQATDSAEVAALLEKQRRALAETERRAEALQKEARRRAQTRAVQAATGDKATTPDPAELILKAGDRVLIETLQQEGVLLNGPDNDGRYEVGFGAFKLKVGGVDLRKLKGKPQDANEIQPRTRARRLDTNNAREKEMAVKVNAHARSEIPNTAIEVDLRGRRAEEIFAELDRYLNDAYLGNLPFVRIVHGKGTGVLRQVVRDILKTHALVSSFRLGENGEGGDGVTIAKLQS
ncbi:MAG: endonuclease MutS2 [Chloroflexota bacterium]